MSVIGPRPGLWNQDILTAERDKYNANDVKPGLAEIYSSADVFLNPTREDNYPTVNMEALACGTPVITFETGGSPEMLDPSCGTVVKCDDLSGIERGIKEICFGTKYSRNACVLHAQKFDKEQKFKEYIELYKQL